MVYPFLLNMWIMKRLDEQYLNQMVALKRITEEEKEMILATPQLWCKLCGRWKVNIWTKGYSKG